MFCKTIIKVTQPKPLPLHEKVQPAKVENTVVSEYKMLLFHRCKIINVFKCSFRIISRVVERFRVGNQYFVFQIVRKGILIIL